ncbi:MAG: hypothetical protein AAFY31_03835 [Pseudomonadota bacterium]
MTSLLGWLEADDIAAPIRGVVFKPTGSVTAVHAERPLANDRHRLELQQRCFRRFPGFAPHSGDAPIAHQTEIISCIERLAGMGQLRLVMQRDRPPTPGTAQSGRAYLRDLRARRARSEAWMDATRQKLVGLAQKLAALDQKITASADALVCDFLVPRAPDSAIAAQTHDALGLASDPLVETGKITVSGLWVPLTFARCGAHAHV